MEQSEVYTLYKVLVNLHGLHELVEIISFNHLVRHSDSEGLHRVALVELIMRDVIVVVVAHYRFVCTA